MPMCMAILLIVFQDLHSKLPYACMDLREKGAGKGKRDQSWRKLTKISMRMKLENLCSTGGEIVSKKASWLVVAAVQKYINDFVLCFWGLTLQQVRRELLFAKYEKFIYFVHSSSLGTVPVEGLYLKRHTKSFYVLLLSCHPAHQPTWLLWHCLCVWQF